MDWFTTARPVRLAAGTGVVPTDGGFLVVTPGEDFLAIEVEPHRRALLAALLAGQVTAAEAVARDREIADVLDVLATDHALAAEHTPAADDARLGEPPPVAAPMVAVIVDGEGLLAQQVAMLLSDLDPQPLTEPTGSTAGHAGVELADAAVLVACADWLPDARWCELDAACDRADVAWHRGYAEAGRWYAGPLTVPGRGPSYADLRLRRLAACPWPDQLTAYWAWLDGGGQPAGGPDPAGAAVAAGLIAADVRAWLDGDPPPGRGVQYGIDLTAGVVRRHPVLPVPTGLLREVP